MAKQIELVPGILSQDLAVQCFYSASMSQPFPQEKNKMMDQICHIAFNPNFLDCIGQSALIVYSHRTDWTAFAKVQKLLASLNIVLDNQRVYIPEPIHLRSDIEDFLWYVLLYEFVN